MFEGNIVFPVLLFSTVSDLSNVYMMGQSSSFDMVLFSGFIFFSELDTTRDICYVTPIDLQKTIYFS